MSPDAENPQTLYVNAQIGLRVHTQPRLASPVITTLPYGTKIQVTSEHESKDNYDWLHLVSDGWIAAQYTQTVPIPQPQPAPVPTPPVHAPPIAVKMRGVHASAGGWVPNDKQLDLVRQNCVESVLIAAYESGQAQTAIQKFRNAGVTDFIIRAATNIKPVPNAIDFVNQTLPRLKEYYAALGGAPMLVAVHNEPNLTDEGWKSTWQDGGGFTNWYLKVVQAYRAELPGVRIGFPALSPGDPIPGSRESEWDFAHEAAAAISASDWVGVHAYFSGDGTDIDLKPPKWQTMAQGKSIIITEGGPSGTTLNTGAKLKNVYAKCAAAQIPVMAWLLSGAGSWVTAGWEEQDVRIDQC